MQNDTVTRDTWPDLAKRAGVSLELIAVLTGVSYSAAYRYSNGSRTAPDAWIDKVRVIIADRSIQKPESVA